MFPPTRHLLEVRRKAEKGLGVRQDAAAAVAEEARVPQPKQAEEHGQVLGQGRGPEVLVHGVGPVQEGSHRTEAVPASGRGVYTAGRE